MIDFIIALNLSRSHVILESSDALKGSAILSTRLVKSENKGCSGVQSYMLFGSPVDMSKF